MATQKICRGEVISHQRYCSVHCNSEPFSVTQIYPLKPTSAVIKRRPGRFKHSHWKSDKDRCGGMAISGAPDRRFAWHQATPSFRVRAVPCPGTPSAAATFTQQRLVAFLQLRNKQCPCVAILRSCEDAMERSKSDSLQQARPKVSSC